MSKTKVPAIPAPTDSNLRDVARAVKSVLDVREGLAGDPLDKSVTFRDLVDGGFADPLIIGRGGGTGSISISPSPDLIAGGTGGGSSEEPDLTPPPQATGLVASAGLAVVILEWDAPVYGNHAFTEIWRADTDVIGNAERVGTTPAAMYNDAIGVTGSTRYYWIRHRSTADVVGPYNSTNGTVATTGKVGNVDLGPLIVEAANLANGSVSATKLAAQAVELTKFANGIEPVTVVAGSTVPTVKSTNTIYLDGTGKLYRWNGTAYVASVPTTDLTGTVASSQIADNAIITAKIADAALTTAKFASTIEPLTIVTGALPTTKSTNTIFRTDDSKTYRWNGSAYVASVLTADLTGTIADAQIAGLAASKITGQLTDTQIADVAAAKVTGQLVASQIADATLTTAKFASTIEPVTIVDGPLPTVKSTNTIYLTSDGKIYRWNGTAYTSASGVSAFSELTGSISGSQIPDATITSAKIADAAVTTAKFASTIEPLTIVTGALPTTKSTNTIYRTDDSKVYRWNGSAYVATVPTADLSGTIADAQIAGVAASKVTGQLSDSQIADVAAAKVTGTLVSSQIADAAITTAKFASSIEPLTIVTGSTLPTVKSTNSIYLTGTGKLYRWVGSAYSAVVDTSDLNGTVSDAQIAGIAASKVTGQLTNSQIADVAAAKVTGQFVSSQIADAAITTAKFASGISPIEIVAALPSTGNFAGRVAFLTADNKLYRHNGTAWIATVASSDISGTISDAQIAGLAASKVTGQLSDLQLAAISAAKISGQLSDTQLAAISAAKVTGTIASTQIADDAITTPKIFAGAITTAKIAASAVTAGEIAAGAITTVKLAASAVTANEIAAGAVIADKIASNAVTTAKLDAGAVTAAKIAAGTITANEIASSTITGGKIAANTITGGNIAADTITAGQIAAGAIGASEVAASAITTDKLFVTGRGSALNDDPFTSDTQAWLSPGLWSALWSIVNITDGPSGKTAIRATSGSSQSYAGSRQVAFNPNKAYRVRAKVRSNGSNGTFYLVVDLRDVNGNVIGGDGTAWFYPVSGATVPTSWTDYEGKFGFGTDRPFPANAKTMSVGALMNFNATTGYHEVQDLRIEEMADASLIVDGAIVASKIAASAVTTAKLDAGAVTAAKIAASTITANEIASGAITTAKIAAGAVTANEIAAATITGGKIAANTITGSNIAADTITAGQIAAGAIGASEIASGSITTSKLLVTGQGAALNDDPGCQDQSAWTGWSSQPAATVTAITDGRVGNSVLRATTSTRSVGSRLIPADPSKTYRLSAWVRQAGNGLLYLRTVDYAPNETIPAQGLERAYVGLEAVSPPANTWTRYSTQFTVPAGRAFFVPHILLAWGGTSGYMEAQDVRIEEVAPADLIVDGAISTSKLAANAVTAAKIAAGTITASEIASSTITGTNIAGGTITGSNIAAGTVQASNIAASTITGDKIAGSTITGSNIAADTITAGQIAAGAISASEVAANAITTDKLLVSGRGAALNPDPSFTDPSAWSGGQVFLTGLTDGPSGGTAITNTAGSNSQPYSHAPIPIEPNKKYRLEVWVKQYAGTGGQMYAGVMWCDAAGTILNNLTPAGWSNGTYSYMPNVSFHSPTTSWVRHTFSFGPGETGAIPSNAKFVRLFIILNINSTAGVQHAMAGFKLMEKADSDLIVDGAITTDKLSANAVTAAKIAANTITASQIASSTITGTQIAGSTITGSNIAADTLTAGNIAAGAIGASEVAAGAITTQKLLVAPASLCPDPYFSDTAWWTATLLDANGWYFESGAVYTSTPVQVALWSGHPTNAPGANRKHVWSGNVASPANGTILRLRARIRNESNQLIKVQARFYDISGNPVFPDIVISSATYSGLQDLNAQGTVPNNAANIRFIIYNEADSTFSGSAGVSAVMLDVAASADLVVDGAITTDKLSANAVTAAKIAANTITASQIASSTITGTNIAGGTITGSNIAAGTIQATNIAGSTITGDKIAGNTISGSNIAGDTITAGNIAAGAIGASEIAADAVIASKVLIKGRGAALNDDPSFSDESAWAYGGHGDTATRVAISDSVSGQYVYRSTPGSSSSIDSAKWFAVSSGKKYRLSVWVRRTSDANGGFFLRLLDQVSNQITSFAEYITPTTSWQKISYEFVPTTAQREVRLRTILNWTGTAGYHEIADFRLEEKTEGDLIVDGAITASKIQAGTITGDRIAGSTITGSNIAGSTITGSNIVGDTITAGNIAAGAIGASEVAAGAITASKILVSPYGMAINDDPMFADSSAWSLSGNTTFATGTSATNAVGNTYLICSVGTDQINYSAKTYPISPSKTYRLSASLFQDASGGRNMYIFVQFYDYNGNYVGSGVTGWGGTMSGYVFGGTLETNGVFMVKGAQFGAGTGLAIPSSVRRVQIGVWFQYSGGPGSTNVIQAAQNLRLEEVVGADLIVDGSIIASKLSAGAIAVGSAAIANGAISNAMLGNAVVDNAKIADAAITNAKIADATIQSAKIAALDAGKITTGTLDAGRIAANSITAGKLSVASLSSITADVGTLTAGIIRNAADSFRLDATNGRTITQVGASMKVTGAPFGSANQFVEWFGPYFASLSSCTEANATYYLKVDGSAYFGGNLSAGTLYNTGATSDLNNNAQITVGPFGTNGNVKTVTLSYSFSGFWTQYQGSNTGTGSGTTSATVLLYRKIGSGAETQVGTLNVTGTWSYETDPEPQPGPTYIRSWTQGMSGSLTYTDNDASTLNRTYRAAMTARSIGFGILDGSYYQRVEIVSVEQ